MLYIHKKSFLIFVSSTSGSDISVVVREALMEPLRLCQSATFFTRCDENLRPSRNGEFVTPCRDDPPCPHCHMKLSSCPRSCKGCTSPCSRCGSIRMRMYDLPERGFSDDKLRPPIVRMVRLQCIMDVGWF